MKVAMVSEHASPLASLGGVDAGGQNVHVACLADALADLGHNVTVYTRRDDPAAPRRVVMRDCVEVVHLPCGPPEPLPKDELFCHVGELAHALGREVRRDLPDVVHAHFWMSALATVAACRTVDVPTAVTFHALGAVKRHHQGIKDTSPPERLRLEAAAARAMDLVLATSNEEVFELVRMGAARQRIALVPCGVDTKRFSAVGPVEPRHGSRHRIVVVSRLVERKGIGNVIAALAQLRDAELVVAGGGDVASLQDDPEARRLIELAAQCGVEDRVELRGRLGRDDVPPLLRSADVVVCAPWYEPFGLVALEAMACGVPVVTTAVGGLVDTVINGVTGVHVPPRDVDALAAALRELFEDPDRRRAFGSAGAERARSRYDWHAIARETARAYAMAAIRPRTHVRRVG
ncbi:MAG TPA: glycosyltransferase [Acidimicrobiia bacterium]|nr:glycosyltransferase [Acidimicrobiia bacterium]